MLIEHVLHKTGLHIARAISWNRCVFVKRELYTKLLDE